jgi:mRNA-degrading endonuclease RelE of RelBE toxin-antitoxin system
MAYRVILAPAAEREYGRLRGVAAVALRGILLALEDDARPRGALKLTGMRNVWRLRVRIDGRPWRVIYRLDETRREVVVARIAPRDEGTYRGLR